MEGVSAGINPIRFTRDGAMFYIDANSESNVYMAGFDVVALRFTSDPKRTNQLFPDRVGSVLDWSPDGRSLVYGPSAAESAVVMHLLETNQDRLLTPDPSAKPIRDVRYSSDGRSVLMLSGVGPKALLCVDTETGQATKITDGLPIEPGSWAVSPDQKTVFFAPRRDLTDGPGTIRIIRRNVDTRQETTLIELPTRGSAAFSMSASPDGQQLAFIYFDASRRRWLMILPTAGGAPKQFPLDAGEVNGTAWTKDSKRVLVSKNRSEFNVISITDGTMQAVETQMNSRHAVLNPENNRIAFIGHKAHFDLWVYRNLLQSAQQ